MVERQTTPRSRVRISILVLATLASTWSAVAGMDPECSRYRVHGIAPGMELSEVRASLGGKGDNTGETSGPLGRVNYATYSRDHAEIYIEYDRVLRRNQAARVALVRTRAAAAAVDLNRLLSEFRERFGEPSSTSGDESATWVDPTCGIHVSVARKSQSSWWQPTPEVVEIELRSLTHDEAAVSRPARVLAVLLGDGVHEEVIIARADPAGLVSKPSPVREPAGQGAIDISDVAAEPDPIRNATLHESDGVPFAGTNGVSMPHRIPGSYVAPRFPEIARRLRLTADIVLRAIVQPDGSLRDIGVLDSTRRGVGFEQAAMDALAGWKYEPATRDGDPVDAKITVRIRFL